MDSSKIAVKGVQCIYLTNIYCVLIIYKPHTVLGSRDKMVSKNRQGPYQMAASHVGEKPGVY